MTKHLPNATQLLSAVRGFPSTHGPVVAAAVELGELHSERLKAHGDNFNRIDWRRAQLVLEIDRSVVLVAPVPFPNARIHTETIGRVIDRIAELTSLAYVALSAPSDLAYADGCAQLEELASAYQDLIDDIAAGTRRLPDYGR
ncbi:DUF4254 domain-containing protein [Nocardia cyriacigeorgica]|uniref:DUF4254 domain-containing protein n=1 Tax=Nocardia cyriacigeorgica TaxID=135487 RepID=UPI00249043AF|nr:DUF4254 domain-containing protein [Nocardia cyriacigeorgica]BDU04608.1 hypothetical protein FMUBM48_08710 [Nocardia cyriacigeorgica]